MGTGFWHTVYQIIYVDGTTFNIIVVLAIIASFAFREAMDGATLTSVAFFPFFVIGGLVALHVFNLNQLFVSPEAPMNAVISGICGIAIMLVLLLIFKRSVVYVADQIHRIT